VRRRTPAAALERLVQTKRPIVLATCVVLLLSALGTALARTLAVPKDYHTIGRAVHVADEGDTVLLAPGIYKETVDLQERMSLVGWKRDETIIVGKENRPVIMGANHTLVRNLTIKAGSVGIRCEGKLMTIEENVITENRESGVHALISLPVIRNNIIVRNDWTGIYCEAVRSLNTAIEHNILAENKYSGISLAGRCELVIQNNIIANNGQYAIWVSQDSRRSRIEFNNLFNNRRGVNQYAVVNATNLKLDPGFPALRSEVYDYLAGPRRSFRGMGKAKTDIGPVMGAVAQRTARDRDGDGVVGDEDQCPGVAEDKDGFEDEDGCPEFDNDKDGVYDSADKCPNEKEDVDRFEDQDGCPDPDNDRDGVPDESDECPGEPETPNGFKDDDGCPDEKPAE
jgi:hypothetical protein